MNNIIVLDLDYIKDLLKRFEKNKELTREINTFQNGLKLEVFKNDWNRTKKYLW